jgi:pSer/pThr/pTyr-binding forkhead associated (FHA) protein
MTKIKITIMKFLNGVVIETGKEQDIEFKPSSEEKIDGEINIGRNEINEIELSHVSVSRIHGKFYIKGDKVFYGNKSNGGSFVLNLSRGNSPINKRLKANMVSDILPGTWIFIPCDFNYGYILAIHGWE